MTRPIPRPHDSYKYHLIIPTRWADNDVYGHVNNSVYYFFFDTVVNRWLIENDLLDIGQSETIGLVVSTSCDFFAPLSFPELISAGLRVSQIGNSSVTYEIGLFREDTMDPAAQGHFTHVYVDEASRQSKSISSEMRGKLKTLEL